MAASAGFSATLYAVGAATAMTNEATTKVSTSIWQITNTAKRILDPDSVFEVATQVHGGGGFITDDPAGYTLDPFFGKVTFTVAKNSDDVVRFNSGSYLPRLAIATAQAADFEFTRASLEKTAIGDSAPSKLAGLTDCSVSLELIQDLQDDLDPGAGTVKLSTYLLSGTPTFLEVVIGGGSWRAWTLPSSAGLKAPVAGLAGATLRLVGAQRSMTGRSERICWSYI